MFDVPYFDSPYFHTLWPGLLTGIGTAFTLQNIQLVFAGCLVGTLVGMLPGLGPAAAIALMLPLTYGLDPASGLILMAGVYYGAAYGGSTASILINAPGESNAVATTFDGYPLARMGKAGKALAVAAYGSFIGGTFGAFMLLLAAAPLAIIGATFWSIDYVFLITLGIAAIAAFAGPGQWLKAWLSAIVGMMLASVGTDRSTGAPRFTFGQNDLIDGVTFALLAMSVFALAEALLLSVEGEKAPPVHAVGLRSLTLTREEVRDVAPTVARSSLLGFLVGVLPGAGSTIASFLAYGVERNLAPPAKRALFGHGSLRGLAAPETANNAASSGAFVPLLTLGIPGSGTTALLLGVMVAYGVQPGPNLLAEHPDVFWGVIVSMYLGNLMLLVLNLPLVPLLARLLAVPREMLVPLILLFGVLGVYLVGFNTFDIYVMVGFAVAAVFLRMLDVPMAPMLLGFALAVPFEDGLTKALEQQQFLTMWDRPTSLALLALATSVIGFSVGRQLWQRIQRLRPAAH